jgi:hypothetical protein
MEGRVIFNNQYQKVFEASFGREIHTSNLESGPVRRNGKDIVDASVPKISQVKTTRRNCIVRATRWKCIGRITRWKCIESNPLKVIMNKVYIENNGF